jgi:hypothetical protein
MRLVETSKNGVGGEIKVNGGEGEFNMIYCKNVCKCHNVSSVQ